MDKKTMFVLFFANLAAMQYHPRNRIDGNFDHVDLEGLSDIARRMVGMVELAELMGAFDAEEV